MGKVQTNFRLDVPVLEELHRRASDENITITEAVDKALREYLKLPLPPIKPTRRKQIDNTLTTKQFLNYLGVNPKSKNVKRDIKKALESHPNEDWYHIGRDQWWTQ